MKIKYCSGILLGMFIVLTAFKVGDSKPFKLPKAIQKDFVFVPMKDATVAKGGHFDAAFFMQKFEVTNADYNEFLVFLKSEGRHDDLAIAQIDSAQWMGAVVQNEPYIQYYHTHPAYAEYPVVNITRAGAVLYCKWMTDRLNASNPESEYTVAVRLPSRAEWLQAANGNVDRALYSWGGPYLRNARGQVLCNYLSIGDGNIYYDETTNSYQVKSELKSYMGVAGQLNDNADITCHVAAYPPNALGIFNLNGNVAEMTTDKVACGGSWNSPGYDVRNESILEMDGASVMIGFRPVLTFAKK